MRKYLLLLVLLLSLFSCKMPAPMEPSEEFDPFINPVAPSGVTATRGLENSIKLTWNEVEDADAYQIWMIESDRFGNLSVPSTTGNSLMNRGFRHVGITDKPEYEIKNLKKNQAFVFAVVSMKDYRQTGKHASAVIRYSQPSVLVEGCTEPEIKVSGLVSPEDITLYWDIPLKQSVLNEESSSLWEGVCDYTISCKARDSETFQVLKSGYGKDELKIVLSEFGFQLDSYYDFIVTFNIYKDGERTELFRSVSSQVYPIHTDDTITAGPVMNLHATEGTQPDAITVSWNIPKVIGIGSYVPVFRIERNTDRDSPDGWEIITDWNMKDDIMKITNEDGSETYSFMDRTAAVNTKYCYRVLNGFEYAVNEESTVKIVQDRASASVTDNAGYRTWVPEDGNLNFTASMNADGIPESASITGYFTYMPESREAWELVIYESTSKDPVISQAVEKINVEENQHVPGSYSFFCSIPKRDDLSYKSEFTFSLRKSSDPEIEYPLAVTGTPTLGNQKIDPLFEGLSATRGFVGEIKLSWTEKTEASAYSIIMDGVEISPSDYAVSGSGAEKTAVIRVNDTAEHIFKLKMTAGEKAYINTEPVKGSALGVPSVMASDGTRTDGIDITIKGDISENIAFEIRIDGNDIRTVLNDSYMYSQNEKTEAGKIHTFEARAWNTVQNAEGKDELKTAWSDPVNGNALGTSAMTASASDGTKGNGIDIEFDGVPGADMYRIYRREKDASDWPSQPVAAVPHRIGKITYTDKIAADTKLGYSYSSDIEYLIAPVHKNAEPEPALEVSKENAALAVGSLYKPPVEVTASNGLTNKVEISWKPVADENINEYVIQGYTQNSSDGKWEVRGSGIAVSAAELITDENGLVHHTIPGSTDSNGVRYSVAARNKNGMISNFQNRFGERKNDIGQTEAANLGYMLEAPSVLDAVNAENNINKATDRYNDYVTLYWSRSRGAKSYTIRALGGETVIDIAESGLDFSSMSSDIEGSRALITNGKKSDEAGYFAYDPDSDSFIYNDTTGTFRDTVQIEQFVIVASSDTDSTPDVTKNGIFRRKFTSADMINISNTIIRSVINEADSHFGGDWWINNIWAWNNPSDSYSPFAGSAVYRQTWGISASYPDDNSNRIELDGYTFSLGKVTASASTPKNQAIVVWSEDNDNRNVNALTSIGRTSGKKEFKDRKCIVEITLPDAHFEPIKVQYVDITKSAGSGKYVVNGIDVPDSREFVRPWGGV